MNIVITAGGTAGHINPALALAEELSSRGHKIIFAGTPNRLESRLVPEAGFDFKSFKAYGFNRKKPSTMFKGVTSILKSTKAAKQWLRQLNVDCVVGFGCYVSLAICMAAKKLNIPYVIHEQNSVMGMANKYLSKNASALCLTYAMADNKKCKRTEITGNPVRRQIFDANREEGRKLLGVPNDAFMLLVFGGSLGASQLNASLVSLAPELLKREDLYIVHITGEYEYSKVLDNLQLNSDNQNRYIVLKYQNKMGPTLASADVCLCRAGASTVAEITARALPALLVPYPHATENHQYYNAKTLVDAGCALLINDSEVKTDKFQENLNNLINNKDLQQKMVQSYSKFNASDAVKKLANIVESSIRH